MVKINKTSNKSLTKKRKVTLILSGGGVRGAFHLGVIRALNKLDVEIDEVLGVSIGAIVGVFLAKYPKDDLSVLQKELSIKSFLKPEFFGQGIISNKEILKILKKHFEDEVFETLKTKLTITALDMNTGKVIVFKKGEVVMPVLASMSIPIVFAPVYYKGKFLCDPATVENIPIKHLSKKNIKNRTIIICDISEPLDKIDDKSSNITISRNLIKMSVRAKSLENEMKKSIRFYKSKCAKVVYLRLKDKSPFYNISTSNINRLIKKGHSQMMKHKNKLTN